MLLFSCLTIFQLILPSVGMRMKHFKVLIGHYCPAVRFVTWYSVTDWVLVRIWQSSCGPVLEPRHWKNCGALWVRPNTTRRKQPLSDRTLKHSRRLVETHTSDVPVVSFQLPLSPVLKTGAKHEPQAPHPHLRVVDVGDPTHPPVTGREANDHRFLRLFPKLSFIFLIVKSLKWINKTVQ